MSAHGIIRNEIDPAVELVHLEFTRDRLYGEVTVKYESGRVVLIRKTESIKPLDSRTSRESVGEHE